MALSQIPKSAPEKTTKLEIRLKRSRLCSRHPYNLVKMLSKKSRDQILKTTKPDMTINVPPGRR